jgi:hypothetical protein
MSLWQKPWQRHRIVAVVTLLVALDAQNQITVGRL